MLIACKCQCLVLRIKNDMDSPPSYFLKGGCVHEAGTHDELLALKGYYYEYVQLQLLGT